MKTCIWKHVWKYMWVKKCVKIHVILFKNWKHVFKWVYQTRPFSPIFIFLCFLLFFIFISPRLCFILFSFFPISCVKIKCFKVVVLLLTETKKPKMHTQNDSKPVWWVSLNSHFHILNNITYIFSPIRISKNSKQQFSNYSTKHPLRMDRILFNEE